MTKRRPSTPSATMKLASLYALGQIKCALCGAVLTADGTEWDHIAAVILDGPHEADNLRPLDADCHKRVTARLARDLGHIRRLTGANKPKRSRPIPARKNAWPPPGTRPLRAKAERI